MHESAYTVTEHDPQRPWIIRSRKHQIVQLDDGVEFFAWASQKWPSSRFSVELDP